MKALSIMYELDAVDRRVLKQLQNDGRLINAELANLVHVSAATCHRRMQRLFTEGYVRAVRAEVAPDSVGRARGPVPDLTYAFML